MKSPNAAYQSRRWATDPAFRLRKYKTDRARILGIKPWMVPDPKPKTGIGIEKHRDKFVVRVRERGKRVTLGPLNPAPHGLGPSIGWNPLKRLIQANRALSSFMLWLGGERRSAGRPV